MVAFVGLLGSIGHQRVCVRQLEDWARSIDIPLTLIYAPLFSQCRQPVMPPLVAPTTVVLCIHMAFRSWLDFNHRVSIRHACPFQAVCFTLYCGPTRPRLTGLLCAYTATLTRFAVYLRGHTHQVCCVPTWPHSPGVPTHGHTYHYYVAWYHQQWRVNILSWGAIWAGS
jgi:hypothetical protein